MSKLYLSDYNQALDRVLVIDGDEHSVWAYILGEDQQSIAFNGFLCSRGNLVESPDEIQQYLEKGMNPPLLKLLANEHAVQKEVSAENISILWDDESANVFINQELFLVMNIAAQTAYSKVVLEDSPYGLVLAQ